LPKIDISKEGNKNMAEARTYLGEELKQWIKSHSNAMYKSPPTREEREHLHHLSKLGRENQTLARISNLQMENNLIVHR
jgi:hypothetical protein